VFENLELVLAFAHANLPRSPARRGALPRRAFLEPTACTESGRRLVPQAVPVKWWRGRCLAVRPQRCDESPARSVEPSPSRSSPRRGGAG
jgi:hypothetical protein